MQKTMAPFLFRCKHPSQSLRQRTVLRAEMRQCSQGDPKEYAAEFVGEVQASLCDGI